MSAEPSTPSTTDDHSCLRDGPIPRLSDDDLSLMREALRLQQQAQVVVAFVTTHLFTKYGLPPDAIIGDDGTMLPGGSDG